MSQLAIILSVASIFISFVNIGLTVWWDRYEKREREQFPYLTQDKHRKRTQ